jgi:hypothetical protein
MLKHLIGVCSFLSNRAITPDVKRLVLRSHNLDQLSRALKPILLEAGQAVGWKPDIDDIEGVESYIQQIHAVDRGSFSFRYATDTEGAPSGMTHLNIYHFANLMERLAKYMDTIAFGFSMEEDLKSESTRRICGRFRTNTTNESAPKPDSKSQEIRRSEPINRLPNSDAGRATRVDD